MSIELYRQFKRAVRSLPPSGRIMPYDWGELPNPISAMWMPYSTMFCEFSREVANAINAFTLDIEKLRAWAVVTAPLSDKRKMVVSREFVDTLGIQLLGAPYMLRSRLIFATAHLSHQANQAKDTGWVDDLPLDKDIYMETTDRYGATWRRYNALKRKLEAIGSRSFQTATHDFRHAYNHRFSPRFMHGITQFVTRYIDKVDGRVWYGFGGVPALQLNEMVAILVIERDRVYAAFDAFQALVREQEDAIKAFRLP